MARVTEILLGAHVSIGGGVDKAIGRGQELGCTAIQMFTRNATQWKVKPLSDEVVKEFKKDRAKTGIAVVAHDSYLINLASQHTGLWKRSIAAFVKEMERAEQLEIPALVMHPGSHKGAGEEAGLRRVIEAFNQILKAASGFRVRILVENTAGQGTALGARFDHLARIIEGTNEPERMGACFDTCHAFAAGYDLRTKEGYQTTIDALDRTAGLDRVGALHLNDCMKGLGQRIDRHEHIGQGLLGLEAFRLIMNDPGFTMVPKIIETPKELDGIDMDPVNLELLRSLVE